MRIESTVRMEMSMQIDDQDWQWSALKLTIGNVITRVRKRAGYCNRVGVRVYSCHQKKIVIERTRDLIYLKFVATDFSPKIISPSAGENSGDLA